jgi:predicted NAD/FAD-dependent oxidoreductase
MAARTLWDRRVDLGASYFTVGDPGFGRVVDDWAARGLAREWTDTFAALGGGTPGSKAGPMRWAAARGLRSLVEDLAVDLAVERRDVRSLEELDADAVVLAMPDPQARRLVADHPVRDRLCREWEPVIAVAGRWPDRTWGGAGPTEGFDGAFVNDDPDVAWVADDGRRRGDDAPVLVAHSTPELAARHLDDPAGAAPAVLRAVQRLLDVGEPDDVHVQRWTFARPTGLREEPYALADGDRPVGV